MIHILATCFSLGLTLIFTSVSVARASLAEVEASASRDLESAMAKLDTLREEIAGERIPLARKIRELEQQVLEKRNEHDRLRQRNEREKAERTRLQEQVRAERQKIDQLDARLGDHIASFEANLHISELRLYQDLVETARDSRILLENELPELSRIGFLNISIGHLRERLGGRVFSGGALTREGVFEEGHFVLFGPLAVFANAEGRFRGVVGFRPGSLHPSVYPIRRDFSPGVEALFQTGAGELPVDPTGGRALRIEENREPWLAHIKKGGIVMIPILLLAGCALAVAGAKWFQLTGMRAARPEDLEAILQALSRGKKTEARNTAVSLRGPVGEMLVSAVEHADEERELLEEVLWEKQLHAQPRLDRLLPFLALTAATAPLLGLLGTVTGMITTFNLITLFGAGDAQTLSGGISEALISTKFGLAVAIPALIAHALLTRKGKGISGSMEQAAAGFINGLESRLKRGVTAQNLR